MCARLLACPLCSQPGFLTLDALRAGLVSVATRPLACPVCNEVLLGIDKLTIHLFGHTINKNNNVTEPPKIIDVAPNVNICTMVRNVQNIPLQTWNILKPVETRGVSEIIAKGKSFISLQKTNSYVKENSVESLNQNFVPKTSAQVIFLQNVTQPDQIYTANHIDSSTSCSETTAETFHESSELQTNFQSNDNEQRLVVKNAVSQYHQNEEVAKTTNNAQTDTSSQEKEPFTQAVWTDNSSNSNLRQFSLLVDYQSSSSPKETHFTSTSVPCKETPEKQKSPTNLDISNGQNKNQNSSQNQVMPHLKTFKLIATKKKTERCNICGFHFPDHNILTFHKQMVHMIDKKDLNIISEHFLKNYPCHLCSKVFKMRGSLMVHMRVAHTGYNLAGSLSKDADLSAASNDNGYNCPTCGKNFKKEQHVTQHLKTHEGKQWECDVCSKMFTTKYFLKKHKRLHSGEMPYKCNICDKTFTFQQSYHKHRLYHKDDKPHMCNTCGRSFKELSTLHNHERIHTGEKPFACETCGKCFRQRVSYLVHRRIHTGVMPYKCTACGKSFRYKVSQRTHKCPVQPPGTVIQHSESLVQRLLQNSEIKNVHNETFSNIESLNSVQNQELQNISINLEENKYVLIVNNQGQHILTRQSDAECNDRLGVNCNEELKKDKAEIWSDVTNENVFKKSGQDSTKEQKDYQKSQLNETRDFFSMVMSPLDNDLTSPSTEMEHLRLSSPVNQDNVNEIADNFIPNSNNLDMIGQDNIEQSYNDHSNGSLHTINEESLKELLYGINSK